MGPLVSGGVRAVRDRRTSVYLSRDSKRCRSHRSLWAEPGRERRTRSGPRHPCPLPRIGSPPGAAARTSDPPQCSAAPASSRAFPLSSPQFKAAFRSLRQGGETKQTPKRPPLSGRQKSRPACSSRARKCLFSWPSTATGDSSACWVM